MLIVWSVLVAPMIHLREELGSVVGGLKQLFEYMILLGKVVVRKEPFLFQIHGDSFVVDFWKVQALHVRNYILQIIA